MDTRSGSWEVGSGPARVPCWGGRDSASGVMGLDWGVCVAGRLGKRNMVGPGAAREGQARRRGLCRRAGMCRASETRSLPRFTDPVPH